MRLSAPTTVVFVIALVVVLVGVLAALGTIPSLPLASVWIVLIGYVILAAGTLFKGA